MGAYREKNTGNWKAKFSYTDWQGQTRWTTKRGFKTKREALEYEREFLMQRAGEVEMTFASFVELYMRMKFPRLKASTRETKTNIINKHIVPYFGNKKLVDITKNDIISWQNTLIEYKDPKTKKTLSKSFLKTVHNQLSAILNYAVRNYDLKVNVAAQVGNMGSEEDINIDFWTKEEYMKVAEELMFYPFYYYCFEVLYWCGMREGELLALTLDDIDFDKGTIRINKTYHHLNGEDIITTPKTRQSNRVVEMPDFLVEELRDYVNMTYKLDSKERLFPTCKSALARRLKTAAADAGVKQIRVHDLRHSHVSLLINLGYSAVDIGPRVGHESVDITYRYAHMFPDAQRNMANSLNEVRKAG